jgi:flagella basal body P-ring formation protein FlgA
MRTLSLLALFLTMFQAPDRPGDASVTVTVKPTPEVAGQTFRLGEIAEITGEDPSLIAQLTTMEIGASPLPGLTRLLLPADIVVRMRYNRIQSSRVHLVSPPQIRVARTGAEIPMDEVVQTAQSSLQKSLEGQSDGIKLEPVSQNLRLYVTPGKREYLPGAPRGRIESGLMVVPVAILVDGKPSRNVEVSFKIKRVVTALVATRTLEIHEALTEGDVTLTQVEQASATLIYLTDPKSVVGKRTTRRIQQGQPLTANTLEGNPVVMAGAKVTLESVIGGVKITLPGVARTQGAVGERIRVYAPDTKKELSGIVVDAGTVRVEEHR